MQAPKATMIPGTCPGTASTDKVAQRTEDRIADCKKRKGRQRASSRLGDQHGSGKAYTDQHHRQDAQALTKHQGCPDEDDERRDLRECDDIDNRHVRQCKHVAEDTEQFDQVSRRHPPVEDNGHLAPLPKETQEQHAPARRKYSAQAQHFVGRKPCCCELHECVADDIGSRREDHEKRTTIGMSRAAHVRPIFVTDCLDEDLRAPIGDARDQ